MEINYRNFPIWKIPCLEAWAHRQGISGLHTHTDDTHSWLVFDRREDALVFYLEHLDPHAMRAINMRDEDDFIKTYGTRGTSTPMMIIRNLDMSNPAWVITTQIRKDQK